MRKYLGSKVTSTLAVLIPIYLFGPLLYGVYVLSIKVGGRTMLLAIGCVVCAVLMRFYIKCTANALYSWGSFQDDAVQIKSGFSKSGTIVYEKCRSCGIGFYTHRASSLDEGTKVYFIFLSYDVFDNSYRSKINYWKPSKNQIKVEYSIELYEYLLSVLPDKQAKMLSQDYENYIKNRFSNRSGCNRNN